MRARSLNTGLFRDGDGPALARLAKAQGSVALGEDRVVLADPRSGARAEARPALADDDHAGLHGLAVEQLDAEALRIRVAAVPGRAKTFLVCHLLLLRCLRTSGWLPGRRLPCRRLLHRGRRLRFLPFLRLRLGLGLILLRRRCARAGADRLNLDLGQFRPEAGVAPV